MKKKKGWGRLLWTGLLMGGISFLAQAGFAGWSWEIQQVSDSGRTAGWGTSVALDSQEKVHVAYREIGRVSYMTNARGLWTKEIIDDANDEVSIALDSQDHVHLAYQKGGSLLYVTNASGQWVTFTLRTGNTGYAASLKLDAQDHVHIGYLNVGQGSLDYISNSSGVWNSSTVEGTTWASGVSFKPEDYTRLTLDANGHAHLCYYYEAYDSEENDTTGTLKYATNASGAWVCEGVDDSGDAGKHCCIVCDSQGQPHISYYDHALGALRLATRSSGSWSLQTVDEEDNVGGYSSIAVDSSDALHISYYDYTLGTYSSQNLCYATNASGTWATHHFAYSGNDGRYTSITTDSAGHPHITYNGADNSGVLYITRNEAGSSWLTPSILDKEAYDEQIGDFLAVDFDAQGQPVIAASTGYHLRTFTYENDRFVKWILANGGNLGDFCTLHVDSAGLPHVCYKDNMNTDLIHAYQTEEGPWSFQTVAGDGKSLSTAMDTSGHLHWIYARDQYLYYNTNASGSWAPTYLEYIGWYEGGGTCVQLDSAQAVHAALIDYDGDLNYVTNQSGSWAWEVVLNIGEGSVSTNSSKKFTALGIDSTGVVHLIYYDKVNQTLNHASKATGTWSFEVLDGQEDPGQWLGLGIDAQDQLYVPYYAAQTGDLKLAFKSNYTGQWELRTLDQEGDVGQSLSTRMSPNGEIGIAYRDATNDAVKFALGSFRQAAQPVWHTYR